MTAPTPDLDAIQARADAATPGTWVYGDDTISLDGSFHTANVLPKGGDWDVASCGGGSVEPKAGPDNPREKQASADAEFIAHARQDVPALVAEVIRLRGLLTNTLAYDPHPKI